MEPISSFTGKTAPFRAAARHDAMTPYERECPRSTALGPCCTGQRWSVLAQKRAGLFAMRLLQVTFIFVKFMVKLH